MRKTGTALSLLEDLLAIELVLARDLLAAAPARPVLGEGTGAALRTVEQAIATADPYPDAVHRALRDPARPLCSQAPGDLTGLKVVHPVADACATARPFGRRSLIFLGPQITLVDSRGDLLDPLTCQ